MKIIATIFQDGQTRGGWKKIFEFLECSRRLRIFHNNRTIVICIPQGIQSGRQRETSRNLVRLFTEL